jgi:hypothetical protein
MHLHANSCQHTHQRIYIAQCNSFELCKKILKVSRGYSESFYCTILVTLVHIKNLIQYLYRI